MSSRVDTNLKTAQMRLIAIWVIGSAIVVPLLVYRTQNAQYDYAKVWQWYLGSLMPVLSLLIGTYANRLQTSAQQEFVIDQRFLRLAVCLSISYLLLVDYQAIVFPTLASTAVETFAKMSLLQKAVESLVTASLGAFFVAGTHSSPSSASQNSARQQNDGGNSQNGN